MGFAEYLRLIATKIDEAEAKRDIHEALRLAGLLIDVTKEFIAKVEAM